MAVKPGWEGRFFEDVEVGDIYRCRLGRTVTEADNIWFTLLTNNTNQLHFNSEYGKRTEFGKCLINSALTLAIVAGMGVADVSENGFALGWDEIKLPNPLFEGDTLYSESEVLEKRESRSNPTRGIVKFRTRGSKQRMIDKALALEHLDVAILDIEDGVTPSDKPLAREQIAAALQRGR